MSAPRDNKNRPVERRVYRIQDFCEAFDISPAMAYKMMATGRLPYVTIAGRRAITAETADKLAREGE